jgi:hypothetical protein
VAQDQISAHTLTAKVQVTIAQADFLVFILFFVDRDGCGFCLVENLHLRRQDFNFTGGHVRVSQTFRAQPDDPLNLDHPLWANSFQGLVDIG